MDKRPSVIWLLEAEEHSNMLRWEPNFVTSPLQWRNDSDFSYTSNNEYETEFSIWEVYTVSISHRQNISWKYWLEWIIVSHVNIH
jgi:hypothetical protein